LANFGEFAPINIMNYNDTITIDKENFYGTN
jgi:hypothetical protein